MAHKCARWLHNPCRPGGSPPLQSGGQNQKWPTSGQGGYITPAAWGVPTASERGAESEVAHKGARWLYNPCRLGVPTASKRGAESEAPHKWARWLHNTCRLGVPTASKRGAKSEVAHKWARWLHNPRQFEGSPPLQSGGQNLKWPISGQGGYITPAASGVPTASERGAESEAAHKWARWLHNPCRLGGPHRFRTGGRIRSGPQVGKVAT